MKKISTSSRWERAFDPLSTYFLHRGRMHMRCYGGRRKATQQRPASLALQLPPGDSSASGSQRRRTRCCTARWRAHRPRGWRWRCRPASCAAPWLTCATIRSRCAGRKLAQLHRRSRCDFTQIQCSLKRTVHRKAHCRSLVHLDPCLPGMCRHCLWQP